MITNLCIVDRRGKRRISWKYENYIKSNVNVFENVIAQEIMNFVIESDVIINVFLVSNITTNT